MLKKILSAIGMATPARDATEQGLSTSPAKPAPRTGAPVYPPLDRGIAFVAHDDVLASQQDLIARLRLAAGCEDEDFDRLFGQVLRNLANTINLLPASESGTHDGAGGLFRLALEVSFYSFQASEATIFSARAGVEQRRVLEPRWRYATWLAGLCIELYRPITLMLVSSSSGEVWPAYQLGLGEWLKNTGSSHYHVRWITTPAGSHRPGQGATAYLAHRIIPSASLQYLHEGSIDIGPTLMDCIAGIRQGAYESNTIAKIVNGVREKVVARDEALRPQRYGKLRVGSHLEPHLLDAMRRLVTNGTWLVNTKKARLWYSNEGLFLIWKTGAAEMIKLLRDEGQEGVPQDPQTLLELLTTAQVFTADSTGSPYWTIQPPEAANELVAVKFFAPLAILAAMDEEPTPIETVFKAAPKSGERDVEGEENHTTKPVDAAAQAPLSTENGDTGAPKSQPKVAQAKAEATSRPAKKTPAPNYPDKPYVQPTPGQERDVAGNVPESLGKAVTPLCRDVIGALIDDIRSGTTPLYATKTPDGFAIGVEQLAAYGVDVTRVIDEFSRTGWLVMNPDKPTRKFHEVVIGKTPSRAIVLRTEVAIDLGLINP